MEWIPRTERLPDHGRTVLLLMDAGRPVGNPAHPGYATGGQWIELGSRIAGEFGGAGELMDAFGPELMQTGRVTHWMEIPTMPAGAAAVAHSQIVRMVETYSPELEALRTFHEFFADKCEALFFAHGWPGVELFNIAAAARRGEVVRPNVAIEPRR